MINGKPFQTDGNFSQVVIYGTTLSGSSNTKIVSSVLLRPPFNAIRYNLPSLLFTLAIYSWSLNVYAHDIVPLLEFIEIISFL
jgi:hypothetical protein